MPDESFSDDVPLHPEVELVPADEELVAPEDDEELVAPEDVEEPVAPEDVEELVAPEDVEVLPALVEVRTVEPASPRVRFAIQAAAAAATGLAAGAATVALARRYGARKPTRLEIGLTRRGRTVDRLPIVETRTYLVRVHEIAHPPE
jgi:hypothetical protein